VQSPTEMAERLRAAIAQGNSDAIRATAEALLARAGDDAQVRTICGRVFTLFGDPRRGLELLDEKDHVLRAKACIAIGRLCDAERHVVAAEAAGDERASGVRWELLSLLNKAGKRFTFPVSDSVRQAMLREHTELRTRGLNVAELLRNGDVRAAARAQLAILDAFGPSTIGASSLDRVGGTVPLWDGRPTGHMVALCIDGYGDFLQFARYLPAARRRCTRLTVAVVPALHSIARQATGADEVVALDEMHAPLQTASAYAMVSFTLALAVEQCYGTPLPVRSAHPVRLWPANRHVGLCWSASGMGAARSIPFAALEPLRALPGIEFHSLQVGANQADAGPWVTRHELRSFDDTAALIASLDAVVSVDTAVLHLAATMGVRTELILSGYEDCRWGVRIDTPWYPTVHIHRGHLDRTIERVRARLMA